MPSDKSYATEQRLNVLVTGIDGWNSLGTPTTGFSVPAVARYKFIGVSGLVIVEIESLQLPVDPNKADGTIVWTTSTGLPAAYQPLTTTKRICTNGNGTVGAELPNLQFLSDGSIKCYGVGGTGMTAVDCNTILSVH